MSAKPEEYILRHGIQFCFTFKTLFKRQRPSSLAGLWAW